MAAALIGRIGMRSEGGTGTGAGSGGGEAEDSEYDFAFEDDLAGDEVYVEEGYDELVDELDSEEEVDGDIEFDGEHSRRLYHDATSILPTGGDYNEAFFDEDEHEAELDEQLIALSRPTSAAPSGEEERVSETTIMDSLQNILPQITPSCALPAGAGGRFKMTDLGYKISQLVLDKKPVPFSFAGGVTDDGDNGGDEDDDDGEEDDATREDLLAGPAGVDEEGSDPFLERTLSGRRRNRTGVRGRPKKIDYGFGKSTTHTLPPQVGKIMGQANMCFVSRKYEEASGLLLEVIRQAPHAYEAYQTLGLIHEETGDLSKALSYYVIAAHLVKTDADLWRKLARLTLDLNRPSEAIFYLSKLIRMRDARPEYFWTRARLLVQRRETRRAVLSFHRLLLGEVEGDAVAFQHVALLAERLDHADVLEDLFFQVAMQALDTYHRIPSLAVVLFILEILFKSRHAYDKIVALIERVAIPLVTSTSQMLPSSWYAFDETQRIAVAITSLPADIRLYYAASMVRLRTAQSEHYSWIAEIDPHRHGLLMKEVGRALLENAQVSEALAIFVPLMNVAELSDADLVMAIGECYQLIPGMEAMAISTFEAVLEMFPDRSDARTALSDLYRHQGDMQKTREVMHGADSTVWRPIDVRVEKQYETSEVPLDVDAIFEGLFTWSTSPASFLSSPPLSPTLPQPAVLTVRAPGPVNQRRLTNRRIKKVRKFVAYSEVQMNAVRQSYDQVMAMFSTLLVDPRPNALQMRQLRQIASPLIEDMLCNPVLRPPDTMKQLVRTTDIALMHGLKVSEWFEVLIRYLVAEVHVGSLERAFRLSRIFVVRSVYHSERRFAMILRLIQIGIACRIEQPMYLLMATRWMFRSLPDLPVSMSLLMRAIWRCTPAQIDGPFTRFLERHAGRNPHSVPILAAHVIASLYTEKYEAAIRTGYTLLSLHPDNRTALLSTAVAILHQSTKRTCRSPVLLQRRALALLFRYAELEPDSGVYNLGRAFHFLGINDLAVAYYQRALPGPFREEAAFNLHLLFMLAGEQELASHIVQKYIQIL